MNAKKDKQFHSIFEYEKYFFPKRYKLEKGKSKNVKLYAISLANENYRKIIKRLNIK